MQISKKTGFILFWVIGVVVFLMDQITKYLVRENFPAGSVVPVIPGFFNLVNVENPGVAFSMFAESASSWTRVMIVFVALIAVVALNVVILRFRQNPGLWHILPYGLILGGALGNLYDRVLKGTVTDFLDFYVKNYHWPAFNVADSAITIGAFVLVLQTVRPDH